ncbi:AB-hydrolase lipase domain [Trinorchestia longiramus]|nr:AB-hydrolase lipase domain [Trinorchestia longiramus]
MENEVRSSQQETLVVDKKKEMMKDVTRTTPEMIEAHGYPAEIHSVTTKDKYILELHRIPHGRKNRGLSKELRPVAYLQHCFLCSSSDWIMNTPDKALGFILADAGYDVWMGNVRGNTYSRKHEIFSPADSRFWQFSWSEMGKYDVPASIDYVLNHTRQEQLYYVGFSMGTTVFFTMMNFHPEYNDKIIGMVALAPVAYMTHVKGALGAMMPYSSTVKALMDLAGIHEVFSSGHLFDMFVSSVCSSTEITAPLCHNILFALTGPDPNHLNPEFLPVILAHTPAGTSLRTLLHFLQIGKADRFQDYDFGLFGNLRRYRQTSPPAFNLTKVTAPVAAFYSENDWLAPPADVQRTVSELGNVVIRHRVTDVHFSHLDFLWARDPVGLVYKKVMKCLTFFKRLTRP